MKDWRDKTQYLTAVITALSGIMLATIQYFDTGDITNGMLGYVGEMLTFTAGIFGATMYVNDRVREIKSIVDQNRESINNLKMAKAKS